MGSTAPLFFFVICGYVLFASGLTHPLVTVFGILPVENARLLSVLPKRHTAASRFTKAGGIVRTGSSGMGCSRAARLVR